MNELVNINEDFVLGLDYNLNADEFAICLELLCMYHSKKESLLYFDKTIFRQKMNILSGQHFKNCLRNLYESKIIIEKIEELPRKRSMKLTLTDTFISYMKDGKYVVDQSVFNEIVTKSTNNRMLHMYYYVDMVDKSTKYPNITMLTYENMEKYLGFTENTITKYSKTLHNLDLIKIKELKYKNNDSATIIKPIRRKIKRKNKLTESKLEQLVIKNIHLVEEGMTFVDNQVEVQDGIIDILARDKKGHLCIIELKIVNHCKDLVFQSAYYPTQILGESRMITIAPDYKERIKLALESLRYVEMKTYKIEDDKITIDDLK